MEYRSSFIREPDIKAVYKQVNGFDLPLWIYLPQGKSFNPKTVVCIHGGGWQTGIQNDFVFDGLHMRYQADYYSRMGQIGVVISYRSVNTGVTVKDLVSDCNDALKYLTENFSFVDKDNIVLMGDSAGAHLSSTLIRRDVLPFKIKAAVLCNPVCDLNNPKWHHTSPDESERAEFSPLCFWGKIDTDVKILLMHGTADTVAEIEDTEKLFNLLKERGADIELVKLEGAKHAFILYNYESDEADICDYMRIINKYIGI